MGKMENPIKMDDLGVPVFSETPIKHWNNSSIVPPRPPHGFLLEKGEIRRSIRSEPSLSLIITTNALSMMKSKNTLMNVSQKSSQL